ncbi:MAG: hypothetical protein MI754_16830 [Chromatiales bacterium]|nr:hypothetical protein [Chromatiales bacterium]
MSVKTPKIVQPGSKQVSVWLLLSALIVVAALWGYREWTFQQQGPVEVSLVSSLEPTSLEPELYQQKTYIAELEEERDQLRLKVATLERTSQIDQEAVKQVRQEMKGLQAERLKMEEELTFLRGLVGGDKKEGLYIHEFQLESGEAERQFRYRFTVSQRLKNVGTASGWIRLKLEGKRADEVVTLSLSDLVEDKADRIKMRFKHFQNVEGVITLPENFEPSSMVIAVEPNNDNLSAIKTRFDWLVPG